MGKNWCRNFFKTFYNPCPQKRRKRKRNLGPELDRLALAWMNDSIHVVVVYTYHSWGEECEDTSKTGT